MITYLKAGWHTRPGRLQLRSDVMDGAIDTASMLHLAAVPAEALTRAALQVRSLTTFIHPVMRLTAGSGKFSARERDILVRRLQAYTDRYPALQCFVNDCFEHVHTVGELRALYLHIVHVSQMMQLLRIAKVASLRSQRSKKSTARKASSKKKSTTKKVAKHADRAQKKAGKATTRRRVR